MALLVVVGFSKPSRAAIIMDGFSSQTNDRFSNDASFVAAGLDLSGVAIANTSASLGAWDDGGRWATMISPNVFLSVEHSNFHPGTGQNITFYASNDPLGMTQTRTVQSSKNITGSDIRIGVLAAPLSSNFAYYDFADQPLETLADFSSSPYALKNAYLFGRSPTAWATERDMAVGRNVLDGWIADVDGNADAVVAVRNSNGDTNYVSSEAYLQVGDSGGPLIVDDGIGNLSIVGLNWFIDTIDGKQINGFSYLGDYADDINDYLAQHSIPEPRNAGFLLAMGILGLTAAVRRKA